MWVNLNSLPDRANGSNDCPSRVGLIFNLKMLLLQTQREQNVNIKVNEAVKTSTLIIFKFVYTCIHKCWYLRSRKNWMNENCLCRMRKRDVLFCINKIHFIFIFFFIYSKQVEMSTCEFFIILQLNYLNLLLFSQAADGKTECNLHQFLRPVNVHCTAKWDNNIHPHNVHFLFVFDSCIKCSSSQPLFAQNNQADVCVCFIIPQVEHGECAQCLQQTCERTHEHQGMRKEPVWSLLPSFKKFIFNDWILFVSSV